MLLQQVRLFINIIYARALRIIPVVRPAPVPPPATRLDCSPIAPPHN